MRVFVTQTTPIRTLCGLFTLYVKAVTVLLYKLYKLLSDVQILCLAAVGTIPEVLCIRVCPSVSESVRHENLANTL